MASFIGTKEEFKRYVGPMLRNLVQQLTKKHKLDVGVCQHCGTTDSLEAAHIHGRERGAIIDEILNQYTNNNIITIDLSEFENHFRKEHQLIDETIIILCKSCHYKYDSSLVRAGSNAKPREALTSLSSVKQSGSSKRIFNNTEIQQRISQVARRLPDNELDKLCNKQICKEVLNIDFPLFIKVSKNISAASKRDAVKDDQGVSRWTWKYEIEKNGFLYAITTQWYERHDRKVKEWLNNHKQ